MPRLPQSWMYNNTQHEVRSNVWLTSLHAYVFLLTPDKTTSSQEFIRQVQPAVSHSGLKRLREDMNQSCAVPFRRGIRGQNFPRLLIYARTNQINELSLFSWPNKQSELQRQHSFLPLLLICGRPCHLSSFKQCSGDLEFVSLPH